MCTPGAAVLNVDAALASFSFHNLMKISKYYDLPDFDPNNLSEAKIKHYIDIIKQKYITYW